jgi:hypothetical protein
MSKSNWTMRWFKMWHNFDDEGKWTAEIDNDELGAWLRLLKHASKCFKRGTVQIDGGIPYSPEQLKVMIKTDKEYIKKWALQGAITIKNGIITIENWESYQCEQDRKDKSSFKQTLKQTLKQTPLTDTLKDSTDLDLDLDLDKDIDLEQDKKRTKTNTCASAFENCKKIWNNSCYAQVSDRDDTFKKKVFKRVNTAGFDLKQIIDKADKSKLIQDKGTWFTFDWIFKNDTNWRKVIDGNYDNPGNKEKPSEYACTEERLEEMLKRSKQ